MKFTAICGLILVGLAYYLATQKKAAASAAPGVGVQSDIVFTDEEAGTITVEAPPSTLAARTYPDPLPAGVLGQMPHRTGDSL